MCGTDVLLLGMRRTLTLVLSFVWLTSFCQEDETVQTLTAGAEFRPIFPAAFLNTGSQTVQNDSYSISVSPKFGFSAGMTIRYGFHKRFALETGINFVQRNFDLNIQRDSIPPAGIIEGSPAFNSNTDFTIIGYEHPIKLLFFVQVADRVFLNAAAGLQLTFFPSDIFTTNEENSNTGQFFRHSSVRLGFDGKPGNDGVIHGGGIINLGMEYRTKNSGYFYLGGTYHVPFADIYRSKFEYTDTVNPAPFENRVQQLYLNGSYLTFDIRYFFNSQPLVKKERKKKSKKINKQANQE